MNGRMIAQSTMLFATAEISPSILCKGMFRICGYCPLTLALSPVIGGEGIFLFLAITG
jgi:hypothetical protein